MINANAILDFKDVIFSAKARWTVRPSDTYCSEVEYSNVILPPNWNYCTGLVLSLCQKGGLQMLTIEGLIAVISLVLTAFGLGYAIGRNSNTRE